MINSIIEAISIALNAEFNEKNYEFYMEEIKQDLKEPCFFIFCLEPTNELFLGYRYYGNNGFVIQYFPESDEVQRECNSVAERMTVCLEYITCQGDDKPIRGNDMRWKVVDGVLNFCINYNLFTLRKVTDDSEPMETLTSGIGVEEGE